MNKKLDKKQVGIVVALCAVGFFVAAAVISHLPAYTGAGSLTAQADRMEAAEDNMDYLIGQFSSLDGEDVKEDEVTEKGYAVSTASEEATMAAASVLKDGGNAVDAAIAAAYVLGVVEPYGSGLGGGGGMLIYDPEEDEYIFLNYYAMSAPSGSSSDTIGIPGFVSGMDTAHKMYGTMDMEDIMSYAIDYARDGVEVSSEFAYRISSYSAYMDESKPFYGIEEGDILVQEDLADTLELIASEGADAFYSGEIADEIAGSSKLKVSDLKAYETEVADAIVSDVDGCTIAAAPAPFSGLSVTQMLKLLEIEDAPNPDIDPQGFIDTFTDIKMVVGAERYDTICDTTYTGDTINYGFLLTRSHLTGLIQDGWEEFDDESGSTETTHVSVIDSDGMVVSMTNTLSDFWGSKVYVAGFYLNDTMTNFGSGVNAYAPGKRPRTFLSPVILRGSDGYTIAAGSPGGNVIPDVVTEVLADILFYGENPQEAVEKQRFVVKDYDSLMVETGSGAEDLVDVDRISGYYIVPNSASRKFGSVNIAGYDNGYFAVSDPHRNGYGYAAQ